jgi:proline iminopeptidase
MYDQIGCGRSESPADRRAYSIESSVQDLRMLLEALHVEKFHLFAHSAGTCIAYEYLKENCECQSVEEQPNTPIVTSPPRTMCLSAAFSSGSYHIQLARDLTNEMERKIKHDVFLEHGVVDPSQVAEIIRTTCMCRTPSMPIQLKTAYSKAGTIWKGLDIIRDYVAESQLSGMLPPLLLLRGEFDFITSELVFQGWSHVFCDQPEIRCITLKGCSHMPMFEDPELLGKELDQFYSQYEQATSK